jgi:hypothetical protein
MSLHVLAKKTAALRGLSENKNFARYMTGSRDGGGCCKSVGVPGPGLIRGRYKKRAGCCARKTSGGTIQDKYVPKVPIKQMGYGIYLKSRTGKAGPGLLAGRLTAKNVGPNNQSSSLYIDKKKVATLKVPACCPQGVNRRVTLNTAAEITAGPTTFINGCNYFFSWTNPGDVTHINGIPQGGTSTTISLCSKTACTNQLVIVGSGGQKTYLILDKPQGVGCSVTSCGTKSCPCTKSYPNAKLTTAVVNGKVLNQKKQRAAYTRGNRTCCVTTKNLSTMSSGDYITRLKAKRACYCADPAQKRVCGGGGCGGS